jgi:hypothetical protein
MSALVQIQPDFETPSWLISIYTTVSAIVICMMSFCFITCTLILVGTLKKFEIHREEDDMESFNQRYNLGGEEEVLRRHRQSRKDRFLTFWKSTCEQDFQRAFLAFSIGVPMFLLNTILATWVKFNFNGLIWPGILVSIVCGITILIMFLSLQLKWGSYLSLAHESSREERSTDGI